MTTVSDPAAIPLGAEDRAILALESDTVAGHTCKVIGMGPGAPGVEALRKAVADRLAAAPELTRRLGGTADEPAWVPDEDFDVSEQIVESDEALEPGGLNEAIARIFEQRLDRSRPLWRIDVLNLRDGGTALVWRLHHALADGMTAMRLARTVLWDEEAAPPRPASHARADEGRRRAHLGRVLEREFAGSRTRSPFDGRIGRRRRIALAREPLGPLHDAAKRLDGSTVNDAVLTVMGGALRRWLEHHHGALGKVRVRVPVSMHHTGDHAANRDSFFSLALPLNEPDPVARLRATHAATAKRKADHDAEELDRVMRGLAGISPSLERFCERLEASPRRFALSVSNVPGPAGRLSLGGAPVSWVHSLAEIGEHHALRASVVSVGGQLCFGLCADPAIVDDLDEMAAGIGAEAQSLIEASRGA